MGVPWRPSAFISRRKYGSVRERTDTYTVPVAWVLVALRRVRNMAHDHARPQVDRETVEALEQLLDEELRSDPSRMSFADQVATLIDLYEDEITDELGRRTSRTASDRDDLR